MTLKELQDAIDWSEIDEAARAWEAEYPGMKISGVQQYRTERLYLAVKALEGEEDRRYLYCLPTGIRSQIYELYRKNGLVT